MAEQSTPAGNPTTKLLDQQIKRHLEDMGSGGGHDGTGDLGERVARLEGVFEAFKNTVEGLRHSQNLVVAIVSLLALVVIGVGVYGMQRIDQLTDRIAQTNDRISEVPGKVSDDVRNLTQTLATTITAARQPAPPPSAAPKAPSH